MHCQQEGLNHNTESSIPTTVEEVSTSLTTCLDLTKKSKEDCYDQTSIRPIKVKLGFSIEDIMKR